MQMITHSDIQALFTRTIYNRGKTYYNQARVVDLYQDGGEHHWHGEVMGSSIYHVDVTLHDHKMNAYCDCPAFDKYGECKHLVAVLLEIADEMEKEKEKIEAANSMAVYDRLLTPRPPQRAENETARQMIQLFSVLQSMPDSTSKSFKRELLQTEYRIKTFGPFLSIEMKVGTGRLYVVKDLKRFIEHINHQEEMVFTKHFSYNPAEHEFSEEDLEVLQILYEITKSDQFYQSQYYSYGRTSSERELLIPPVFADQLLELLQHRNCAVEENRRIIGQLELAEHETPFSFQLNKEQPGVYILNFDQLKESSYLREYKYLMNGNKFYKLSHTQSIVVSELLRIMEYNRNNTVTVDAGQMEPFVSHVLPELKKIGDLHISEAVSDEIIDRPLEARLLIDYAEDRLKASLEFHYGDQVVHPFHKGSSGKTSDGILMREVEKENEIIHFLEQAEFQINEKELYLEAEEDIFHFLFNILPQMKEKAEILLSDQALRLIRGEHQQPKIEVDIEESENFLEVNFDMEDISEDEIRDVIQSVVERKTYHRLSDGSFLSLEQDGFSSISRLFKELDLSDKDVKDGSVQLPVLRSLQVEEVMADGPKTKFKRKFRELIHAIKHPDESDYPLPTGLEARLRDYQYVGFQWLKGLSSYGLGGILADDMGLGKTLQSIAYLLSEKEERKGQSFKALVVSPSSLVYNWKNEFEKFAPSMHIRVISGTKTEREALLEDISDVDVLITSYQLLRQDLSLYRDQTFSVMILDEAQAIKNDATKTARAVKSVAAARRFALSGTPIENSLDELWSIFDAVLPGLFPAKRFFKQWSQEKVSRISRPFILRRVKQDVLNELPEKIEHVHTCELTDDQKRLYLGYLERIQGETRQVLEEEGLQKGRIKILAGLTRLRQLCCHPSLFIENYEGDSGKLSELLDLVDTALENGQRMLIFSQFSSMLSMIRDELESHGKEVFYLDGQTPSKTRVQMAERFNRGEKDIFLISLKAGGTGLNLTGADTVVLFDLWWNPAVEDQAAGRAHRMGQKKVVQVFRLITRGTIEEKIHKLQQKKKELIENVIQPGETMLSSLNEEDIKELLGMEK